MLKRDISTVRSATSIRLKKFGLALKASHFSLPKADQLVFLCGANTPDSKPSARRAALKRFVESIPNHRVVYAEAVFNELGKISSSRKNVLDLEQEISLVADKIVVVLESPSAFCELGAFAHPELRKKLIVVNDLRFKGANSFINTGPIAAIREAKSFDLWYRMSSSGTTTVDGIGSIFSDLRAALLARPLTGSVRFPASEFASLKSTKESLYFVHDLVLFTGPATHEELIAVMKVLYGDRPYDRLKDLLGVLRSAGLVESREVTSGTWIYRTLKFEPYLTYPTNISALTSAFRLNHFKNNPRRLAYG